jgi:hypothetical protein
MKHKERKRLTPKKGGEPHRGRPFKGDEHETITHKKPWLTLGISERTWWRWKKIGRVK